MIMGFSILRHFSSTKSLSTVVCFSLQTSNISLAFVK